MFLVKRVPGQGPEQRESGKIVLYLQIIIIWIGYYTLLLNYWLKWEPSQPKPETELWKCVLCIFPYLVTSSKQTRPNPLKNFVEAELM